MKKGLIVCLFVVAMVLAILPVSMAAAGSLQVSETTVAPGETVTVAVRIVDNPGFTNFSVLLDYDREHLTLTDIQTNSAEGPYLCGTHASSHIRTEADGRVLGCVVAASALPVKADGILFTATFTVSEGFCEDGEITPIVQYIRNNEAVFSIFEEIRAAEEAGVVVFAQEGDVNCDGIVEYDDVMLAYKAFLGEVELTPKQMAVADTNRSGTIEEAEYQAIYQIYIGGST